MVTGIVLALGADAVSAAIGNQDAGRGTGEGELFFTLHNGLFGPEGRTYILDTGIQLKDMRANPEAFNNTSFDLSAYPGFTAPAGSKWAVYGERNNGSFVNRDDSYYMTTENPTTPITAGTLPSNSSFFDINGVQAFVTGTVQNANLKMPAGQAVNAFETYTEVDPAFQPNYGDDMSGAVTFKAFSPTTTTTMAFHLLGAYENPETLDLVLLVGRNQPPDNNRVPLGYWQLNGARLSFTTTKPATQCSFAAADGTTLTKSDTAADNKILLTQAPFAEQCTDGAAGTKTYTCSADGVFKDSSGNPPGGGFVYACRTPKSCTLEDGSVLQHGASKNFYKEALAKSCDSADNARELVCQDGALKDKAGALSDAEVKSYGFASCTPRASDECEYPGDPRAVVADGRSVFGYRSATSDDCEADAVRQILRCDKGNLVDAGGIVVSPKSYFRQCNNNCKAPWGGESIAFGSSNTVAWEANFGSAANCADVRKETLSCSASGLAGSVSPPGSTFKFRECQLGARCPLPWGGEVAHGQSVNAWQASGSTACDAVKASRTCINGTLSGDNSFQFRACEGPLTVVSPNGGERLRVGMRGRIQWRSTGLSARQRVTISFAKSPGARWQVIRARLRPDGALVWTPRSRHVTNTGLIRACVPKTSKSSAICDQSDQVFQVVASPL